MTEQFYSMADDVEYPGRWYLGAPLDALGNPVDPEMFRVARTVTVAEPLRISIRRPGSPLDFTFASLDMPVANARTTELLRELAPTQLQIFAAAVDGQEDKYFIINILPVRFCVDESKSEFMKWTKDDHRADLASQYRMISRLRVDSNRAAETPIFRLGGYKIVVIVSDEIRDVFVAARISGVRFAAVSELQ